MRSVCDAGMVGRRETSQATTPVRERSSPGCGWDVGWLSSTIERGLTKKESSVRSKNDPAKTVLESHLRIASTCELTSLTRREVRFGRVAFRLDE